MGFVESVASGAMSVETSRGALRRLLGVGGVESGEVELRAPGRPGWILRLREWVRGGGKDGVGEIGGDELADCPCERVRYGEDRDILNGLGERCWKVAAAP